MLAKTEIVWPSTRPLAMRLEALKLPGQMLFKSLIGNTNTHNQQASNATKYVSSFDPQEFQDLQKLRCSMLDHCPTRSGPLMTPDGFWLCFGTFVFFTCFLGVRYLGSPLKQKMTQSLTVQVPLFFFYYRKRTNFINN